MDFFLFFFCFAGAIFSYFLVMDVLLYELYQRSMHVSQPSMHFILR